MLFEVFDSITDGWLKTRFKTWHAPKTLKTIQLNLIIWHVLGISIQNQTIFKMLPQNMTCLKILAQNLTRFSESCFKMWSCSKNLIDKNVVFFTKNYPKRAFQYSKKVPTVLFLQCETIQRNCFFFKRFLQWILIFRKKLSLKIWSIVKYSIQILKDSKKFSSKSDMLYKLWF